MRIRFLLFLFLLPICAAAQKDLYPYYQQNAVIVAPTYDCYHQNLDAGLAAKRRGDCTAALKHFQEALDCEEVAGNTRWMSELEALIQQCQSPSGNKIAAMDMEEVARVRPQVAPVVRRRYVPSKDFLAYTGDSCFVVTSREADRAYYAGFWDDAAKLYRAAKSCRDADQSERARMNTRISACRDAAEDELRQKEQAAIRAARHAIANNTADDAQDNLRNYNRTLAYRLADFANDYIAPEDNPRCIQALLDAWYYRPIAPSDGKSVFQVPLCYQIATNLPLGTEIRHLSRNNKGKIYAFAPNQNLLWSWDARSFVPHEPIQLGEKYNSYEASPDGETLVFAKNNQYLLWRSPRQSVKVLTATSSPACFNQNGDVFYYFDVIDQTINAINLKDAFGVRKGSVKKGAPLKFFSSIGQDLNNFAVFQDACWLAYSDRIEIWKQQAQTKAWSLVKTVMFGRLPQYTVKIYLYPETGSALVSGDSSMVFNLNAAGNTLTVLNPYLIIGGQLFAATEDGTLIAATKANDSIPDRLIVNTTKDGSALFSTLINHNDWPEFPVATFSRDHAWLFSVSLDGTLFAWDLSSSESDWLYNIGDIDAMALTPDGMNLVGRKNRDWVLIDADTHKKSKDILSANGRDIKMFALSNAWVAFQTGADSIHLKSYQSDQTIVFPVRMPESQTPLVAFSPDENLIAYTDAAKSITIRSLESGAVIANRTFDGNISGIQLLPGSEEVVVVQGNEDPVSRNLRTIAKIWRFVQQDAKLRVVRLHNYEIKMMNVSPNSNRIAFSDGRDVRIFNLNDLSDETVRIYRNVHRDKEVGISAIAFHPNGLAMAVGYADGSVNMWDAEKGTVLFRLQKTGLDEQFWVKSLAFTNGGRKLRQLNADFTLATRDLDPAAIRGLAQTNYRKLVPFTPEQIREYELESAMNYPGNFERLAESGEWPLIQAFFQYYYQQASRSNNISEVTRYSERAFILYQQLDPGTQNTLRGTMLEIYRDLHWKWILRGRVKEAAALVNHINQYFDRPFVAIEAVAYTDLLSGNLRAAAKSFTDWSVLAYRNRPQDGLNSWPAMDTLQNKVRQMAEYDLLDASQRAFICGMFGNMTNLNSICPDGGKLSDVPFDNESKAQWNILLNRVKADHTNNLGQRDKLLQQALESARQQYRQNPEKGRSTLQELIFDLAQNDYARGKFEQGSKDAVSYFRKSIGLLQESKSNLAQAVDSARLYLLTANYFEIGRLLLQQDHVSEGVSELAQGTRQANSYLKVAADTLSNHELALGLFSELYEQLGVGLLLSGNAADAQDAFQNADRFQQFNSYSSADQRAINVGHADLLANDTIGALIQYGSIQNEEQLGNTLVMMERLADKKPEKKALIQRIMPRVKAGILAKTSLNTKLIDYWFARSKYEMYIGQSKWDSTLYWSEQALKHATNALDTSANGFSLKEIWLREHLNLSFYLILVQGQKPEALGKAIQLSEAALQYVQANYPTYQLRDLLKTNLAHAYWLRNQPGDRAKSIQYYQEYLKSTPDYGKDNWETLEKDFRDFSNAGIRFADFPALMDAIKPADE
ncbi:MAG: WD40 repeat domain-containing protein [Bacteroidota bacterium]